MCGLSHIPVFAIPMMVAHQAPLSLGLSRQEYWSGLPFPPPGHLPDSAIKPECLTSPALAAGFFATSTTWEALSIDNNGADWSQQVCHAMSSKNKKECIFERMESQLRMFASEDPVCYRSVFIGTINLSS